MVGYLCNGRGRKGVRVIKRKSCQKGNKDSDDFCSYKKKALVREHQGFAVRIEHVHLLYVEIITFIL